jgi:hypothetical protein
MPVAFNEGMDDLLATAACLVSVALANVLVLFLAAHIGRIASTILPSPPSGPDTATSSFMASRIRIAMNHADW